MADLKLDPVPPWEAKWNTEALVKMAEQNPRGFARGFRMEAHSQDELWFPSFKSCFNIGANLADIRNRGLEIFVGVDISASGRDGTAVTVVGLERSTSLRYLMEITYGAWRFQDTIKFLAGVTERYQNINRIIVENNVMQQALIDDIMVTNAPWRWLVDPFTTTGQNKNHPEVGLAALESEFSKQAWVIPSAEFASHPAVCQCHWCRLVMEISTYPMAATSDGLMSLWFSWGAIQKWGSGGGKINVSGLNLR